MDDSDPLYSFFPEASKSSGTQTILYTALSLMPSATPEEIRKSYRRLALRYHPDKHSSQAPTQEEKEEISKQFQRIGFAYAVLSDETRKKRYDSSGRTDDKFADAEEMGWDRYFESLFTRVDRKILDDDKKKYQGSEEEQTDLIKAYNNSKGSLPDILSYIPHSQYTDEARFISKINSLIADKTLKSTPKWEKTSTDENARAKRARRGEKDAKEAEKVAKDLGVWEEFYGSGAKGKRMGDGEGTDTNGQNEAKDGNTNGGADGDGGLQALIFKRQREREGGLSKLEEKYKKIEEEARARKRAKKGKGKRDLHEDEEGGAPDISDADFEALQAKMFAKRGKPEETKSTKATKGRTKSRV